MHALRHHQAGRSAEAAQLYRQVLAADPNHADSLHLLGMISAQMGQYDLAIDLIRRAIAVDAKVAYYHCNLGAALRAQGYTDEAVACFGTAIGLHPEYPEAHFNLGAALADQGRADEAAACYRRTLTLRPDHPDAHNNLGVLLKEQGRLDEAMACFRRTLALRPDHPEAHNNLGVALAGQGQPDQAGECFRRAIALRAGYAAAHSGLGIALKQQGRLEEAAACFRRALELQPDFPAGHYNLGNLLREMGQLEEAVVCYRRAVALRPDNPQAHTNLGIALQALGRLEEASAHYARLLEIRPDDLPGYSNLLFTQNYLANRPPDALRDIARRFGGLISRRAGQAFTGWSECPPDQPLRVGLVSGDLRNHPVGFFLEGLLRAADPARVAFLAFPSHDGEDELTSRIKPHLTAWQPIHALNDAAAAHLIHAERVQVLLDLSGHTDHNRLPVFAWRPAPVQATWLGYVATTGVAEMDYIIGDPHVAPACEFHHFTETVWTLPEIYYCFTPPAVAVEVSGLPALSGGGVTFGCFNNLSKITDQVICVWARVLRAVPGSRLMLKAGQLRDPAVRSATRARFAAHGIGAERLLIEPPSPRTDYLRAYHRIDIALDPFPYPGGTTSCEALWMGVPVLTRRGNRFLSHAGETIARNAGLADWIADGDDDYVTKAVRFAADLEWLARLRGQLRAQVLASPVFDAPRFARHFEDALWGMWERWRGNQIT